MSSLKCKRKIKTTLKTPAATQGKQLHEVEILDAYALLHYRAIIHQVKYEAKYGEVKKIRLSRLKNLKKCAKTSQQQNS